MTTDRRMQCIQLLSGVPLRFWIWTTSIVLWASRSTSDLEKFKSGYLSQKPLHVDISWSEDCGSWMCLTKFFQSFLPRHTKDRRIPLRYFVASWSQCFALVWCLCGLNTGSGARGAQWVFRRGWCDFQVTDLQACPMQLERSLWYRISFGAAEPLEAGSWFSKMTSKRRRGKGSGLPSSPLLPCLVCLAWGYDAEPRYLELAPEALRSSEGNRSPVDFHPTNYLHHGVMNVRTSEVTCLQMLASRLFF